MLPIYSMPEHGPLAGHSIRVRIGRAISLYDCMRIVTPQGYRVFAAYKYMNRDGSLDRFTYRHGNCLMIEATGVESLLSKLPATEPYKIRWFRRYMESDYFHIRR